MTFRLADSLPAATLRQWVLERDHLVARAASLGRPLSEDELNRLNELHSERIERWLDQGHGCCALRLPEIAALVAGAIQFHDGVRHDLMAWCIMPNHVHLVIRPLTHSLSEVLRTIKGYTGKQANELRGTSGAFWQSEPYDHLIRDRTDLARQIAYVVTNPSAAGLVNWPWVGRKQLTA